MRKQLRSLVVASAVLAVGFAVAAVAVPGETHAIAASSNSQPPTNGNGQVDQWYWEISAPANGLAGLPCITATETDADANCSASGTAYPAPASANIWDTDLFADSNIDGGIPTGPSPVVQALHAAGKYSICYIEAGAYQTEPDSSNFAPADYGDGGTQYEMAGWPGEYWYDTSGFAGWSASDPTVFPGGSATDQSIAANIAAGMAHRIEDCAVEGQDALEPDDLDGYTNASQTGVAGGGWGLTQADAAGYEAWLAYTAHHDGLAIFQKNDPANASVDEPTFDGMIIEECNHYDDPCSGSGGDATAYLEAGKPVLNAEYTSDGETTPNFCPQDIAAGITGALFDRNLDGATYEPCEEGTQSPATAPTPTTPTSTSPGTTGTDTTGTDTTGTDTTGTDTTGTDTTGTDTTGTDTTGTDTTGTDTTGTDTTGTDTTPGTDTTGHRHDRHDTTGTCRRTWRRCRGHRRTGTVSG